MVLAVSNSVSHSVSHAVTQLSAQGTSDHSVRLPHRLNCMLRTTQHTRAQSSGVGHQTACIAVLVLDGHWTVPRSRDRCTRRLLGLTALAIRPHAPLLVFTFHSPLNSARRPRNLASSHHRLRTLAAAMEDAVSRQHAHPNTIYHCLHAYYHLNFSRKELALVFSKSTRTISNWITQYEKNGLIERKKRLTNAIYSEAHRMWIFQFYVKHPLSFLDETQAAFVQNFAIAISITSIWRIVHSLGLTRKVLERRAMHVRESDIFHFVQELNDIDWAHSNLVFLDEVSFDNRGMIRKRGYALRGQTLAIRGDVERKPRVLILAFIGADGLIDYFATDGTFDRFEFTGCCQDFVHSKRAAVRLYPGRDSVWILDGASIHRHPEIVHYLRSVGVVPVFLPAYCPFFNPIEVMFGLLKRPFQRHYVEKSSRDLMPFVVQSFRWFEGYNMRRLFEHCGWMPNGVFSPVGALSRETQPRAENSQ